MKKDEEAAKRQVEHYQRYLELSPEERKREDYIQDLETAKMIEQFRGWFNSEERRQFDAEYEKHKSDRAQTE